MAEFIHISGEFYIKQCETAPQSYDIYRKKMNVNRERYPDGKMEDISYSVPLPWALHRIANALAAEESANIHELADNLKKYQDDFLESVKQIVKTYKS